MLISDRSGVELWSHMITTYVVCNASTTTVETKGEVAYIVRDR